MPNEKLKLDGGCYLESWVFEGYKPEVSLHYTEHSPDTWYGDTETDICIDREKALEIIEFLKQTFNISLH